VGCLRDCKLEYCDIGEIGMPDRMGVGYLRDFQERQCRGGGGIC